MSGTTLAGRRVLITRAADDAEVWAERLTRLGARPVLMPCLTCIPVDGPATASALIAALADASWLLLSSRHGAEVVASLLAGRLPPGVQVGVVGPSTAEAARRLLGRVDLVAARATSRGLADAMLARLGGAASGERIVVAGAANGRDDAASALTGAGARVTVIPVYRTVPAPPPAVKRDLAAEGVDDILLASPSAVRGLVNCAVLSPSARIITIGPTTTAAALAAGLAVAAESRRPDLEGMLEVMS